jgi:putative cell wall-binding protein
MFVRFARLALAAILALPLATAAGASIGAAPASAASPCAPWPTSYATPFTIRVLRTETGTVETVPFRTYVENVMSWEWPASYPEAALRVGAIAVKQYALYYLMSPRGWYETDGGECYHVRDDSWDQVYDPLNGDGKPRVIAASIKDAVAATWTVTMRRDGRFFLPHYWGGESDVCGAKVDRPSVTWLPQREVRACAIAGMSRDEILSLYLGPELGVANAIRRFGPDRFETAAAIAAASVEPGASVVYVASGLDFPDALAAGPAAALGGGAVLLVWPDAVPAAAAQQLERIGPARIRVVGGPSVVDDTVLAALGAYGADVARLSGPTRYDTALAVVEDAFADPVETIFVATGRTFPDALAGSAAAARLGAPVVLVPGDALPDEALATRIADLVGRLAPTTIRVLGGPSAVGEDTAAWLASLGPTVERLAGVDRYETAAAISAAVYGSTEPRVHLATGLDFPDALAGGPLGGPLLLVKGTAIPAAVAAEVERLEPARLVVLGGPTVVGDGIVTAVARIRWPIAQ